MEENQELEQVSVEEMNAEVLKKDTYTPRPKWQIIAAWVGIAIVGIGFLLYCWQIANGGM